MYQMDASQTIQSLNTHYFRYLSLLFSFFLNCFLFLPFCFISATLFIKSLLVILCVVESAIYTSYSGLTLLKLDCYVFTSYKTSFTKLNFLSTMILNRGFLFKKFNVILFPFTSNVDLVPFQAHNEFNMSILY